ncbi:MAG: aminotransferase class I/II-fold pyridoxal phosphate-dependent enzyme [Eubacterium sp.]|jgi:threonine-phosphate decarboxylase|nr:aminotransferase class I/II-fold pyridoxal phosphate-dependent enzyme [Eubacterium sp.]
MYKYSHGGDIYNKNGSVIQNIIDLSTNINPLGMPKEAIIAAKTSIDNSHVYPDFACRALTSKLAEFEDLKISDILCGNGASDILFRLAFALKPKKALIPAPSFNDYSRACEAIGASVKYYFLKKDDNFNIRKDIIEIILLYLPDMVFICNPNNPTGSLTEFQKIEEIASACKAIGSLLVIDECFLDFASKAENYSAKSLIKKYKNIVILKAFTKMFSMPGLRLGYAISENIELLDRLRHCGPDWSVSNAAQSAGIAALKNGIEYMKKSRSYIKQEREFMIMELNRIGFTVYPSSANFIFFYCPFNLDLHKELLKNNILIRNCENFKGLKKGFYRSAVATNERNAQLIKVLHELLSDL